MKRSHRLIMGVIGNDIHIVANRILARGLRQAGYNVCNLGVSVDPKEFLDAAKEYEPDAIVISSINGEGESWATNFPGLFKKAGFTELLLYIGGNLVVGERCKKDVEKHFLQVGFNRAYHQPSSMDQLLDHLALDLVDVK